MDVFRAVLSLLGFRPGSDARPAVSRAKATIPDLEKTLKENILGFWLPRTLDREHGGYIINFGPRGEPNGKTSKGVVTQARHLWLFSRSAREGYEGTELLEAAGHGYRFLCERMWDREHGGFFWEVSEDGNEVLRGKKHLVGQWYPLYAISEYFLATGRADALDVATRIFTLLEEKSYDRMYGGYLESFNEDWSPARPGEINYMGVPSEIKLLNTHLHILEALAVFHRASKLELARQRLLELITIQGNAVVRKEIGACTATYARDWRPLLDRHTRIGYGHDLENISLLIHACESAGVSNYILRDTYKALFAYSLTYGYDKRSGGFFEWGPLGKPADCRDKIWWVQAEALWASLNMYRLTGDAPYLEVFLRTWDFTRKYQVDWKHGEWWEKVTPGGVQKGDKAHIWKAGYHQGRAMIECLAILRALE